MENASKALIIAASILLAILVISMGVMIFNKAQSSYNAGELDSTEINMFNQKFERYANNQLGSQVKSLISFAISNASTNKDDPVRLPKFVLDNTSNPNDTTKYEAEASNITVLGNIRKSINSTHTYDVDIHYGNSGLIDIITIYYDVNH